MERDTDLIFQPSLMFEVKTSGLYYKSFMIVIYDCNDNGLYYKTTIIANLTTIIANSTLAWSVNYDHKACCKLKRTFMIVNYNHKPLTVQATGECPRGAHLG
jgi:hypothetical protein